MKWPKEVVVAKSAQEMSDKMMELEMREDKMGVKVDVDGILTYGHVRWAKQMHLLCEKDITGLLIPQVRQKLPQAMRSLVSSAHTDWKVFLQAVSDVSVPDLLEEIEKEKRLRSLEALKSPTALLRVAMAKASIILHPSSFCAHTPSTPTICRVTAPNLFVSNGPIHPSNLFAPSRAAGNFQPSTPSAQIPVAERLMILQRNLPVHHPNTPAGRDGYVQQIATYKSVHGESTLPNKRHPYPLTPGTAPLDSGACYNCAQSGHLAKDREGNLTCPNPSSIPDPKRRWRNIAGFIYRMNRQASPPTEMRYVNTVQPYYDPNTNSYFMLDYDNSGHTYAYEEEQGKGQGSSE
jgi:hypothetical protein